MCDVPRIAVFCSESIECFPGIIIIIIIIIMTTSTPFGQSYGHLQGYEIQSYIH